MLMILVLALALLNPRPTATQLGGSVEDPPYYENGNTTTVEEPVPSYVPESDEQTESGSGEPEAESTSNEATEPELPTTENTAVIEDAVNKVDKDSKTLSKLVHKLELKSVLTPKEHRKVQHIAEETEKIEKELPTTVPQKLVMDDHVVLTQAVLDNHNKRLKTMEGKICKLTDKLSKNKSLLTEVKNKLIDTVKVRGLEQPIPACGPFSDRPDLKQIKKTTKKIRKHCPVCPSYALTTPPNVLDVFNNQFGTISSAPPLQSTTEAEAETEEEA